MIEIIENMLQLLTQYGNVFVSGVGYTLLLSAITVCGGLFLGSLLALMKMSTAVHIGRFRPLNFIATAYIEIIRGTPLLLQLYFYYFLLPDIIPQLNLGKFTCITIALLLNSAGYVAEIVRAGIEAVDKGQTEAARSLGFSVTQTMIKIVMPQAVKNILPALCNEFVTMIKETSLASTFFVGDLMTSYKTISGATYLAIEPLIIAGIIYFIMTFTMSKGIALLERRMKNGD